MINNLFGKIDSPIRVRIKVMRIRNTGCLSSFCDVQNGVSVYVDTSAGETSSEVEEAFHMCASLALQARADSAR